MNPLTQSKNATIFPVLIALTLGCFGLSPQARAVCQEGCLTSTNTVLGEDALLYNTIGSGNTAIGFGVLYFNTDGYGNTAIGGFALEDNTTGIWNTATGVDALQSNRAGFANTANGAYALLLNTTGSNNTAIGFDALLSNKTGRNNIAVGFQAGVNLTTGNDNIDIGNDGVAGESAIIRIGTGGIHTATLIAGIREAPLAHGVAVGVGITADGQLGVRASSARFKEAIKPMDKTSEVIFSLRPVTFRYKKALDPQALPQFGLVAEEVAKVNPDLVACDAEGRPFTVRYDEVNAMLLNEFLKEHRGVQDLKNTVGKQEAMIAQQQEEIQALTAALKAQAAQIQKVSDQLGAQAPAPRLVTDN